jgi:hypothetical protein
MDAHIARSIAEEGYRDRRNRFGDRLFDHAHRVADAVPTQAQAVAWLHELLEETDADPGALCERGLSPVELAALELLTRMPTESYELYALRIAFAPGPEGALARTVKVADIDDHLAHARIPPAAPPYRWARRHIMGAAATV